MVKVNPYIFREYDIRGVVEKDLTDQSVELIGKAFGTYLQRQGGKKVTVGGDIRLSTERFKQALIRGLISTGIDVSDIGVVPTPVLYFSLFKLSVDGGVMITGSHNPPEFNGFKMSVGQNSIYGQEIQKLREIIEKDEFLTGKGSVKDLNIIQDYIKDITDRISIKKKIKVVFDCGNGAGSLVIENLMKALGVDAYFMYCEPDGTFPNHHPDPTVEEYLKDLRDQVLELKADLGIAFDGDADRIGVIDDRGEIIWGDRLLIMFARNVLKEKKGQKIIFEVKCSQALPEAIEAAGGEPIMWKTGHSLLKKKMKETGAVIGGEMSGHLFFADRYHGYDDAVYAAARLIELLSDENKKPSELLADIPKYSSTPEIRLEVDSDEEKFEIARKAEAYFKKNYEVIDVDGVRILFGDGWGLVRASNTQPVLVLRFEARTEERLKEIKTLVINKLEEFGRIRL
ncbi:MAG: phosphomannomutase/phosphoglucomutase [Calditrichaeota bacterium]|nr:phosphomannomutase/phosphoglucomutase [Calditrichota bacterium]RQV92472.1 MAG: phosphomannomutase/phosphoglucomutase [bacterium]RQV99002.1 MAG: phosphomannomutase/phosphoglucomutase [Calditrichota bacterium]